MTFDDDSVRHAKLLLGRIAGYHGYAFRSQTRTRAQGTLVTYVRYR